MEREPEARPEVEAPTRRYRLAELRINHSDPLREAPRERVAEWIQEVVAVESPVHLNEATIRICRAAGVARAGSRIQEQLRQGARHGVAAGMLTLDHAGFLWQTDPDGGRIHLNRIRFRDGDLPPSLRDPTRIPGEEIAIALLHAVRASFGIDADDAVREAVRLFGYQRGGPRIAKRFGEVLDFLVADGTLVREGSLLRVNSD